MVDHVDGLAPAEDGFGQKPSMNSIPSIPTLCAGSGSESSFINIVKSQFRDISTKELHELFTHGTLVQRRSYTSEDKRVEMRCVLILSIKLYLD